MTGVKPWGGGTQQDWAAGGASIDQLLLDKSPVLGGPTQTDATKFGSLQLGADVRSDRNEVAPRVLSYKAPIAGSDVLQRRQPLYPDTSPLNVFGRIFGGTLPTGTDPQKVLAQKLSVCDFMRKDIARLQTLIPASEKDKLASQLDLDHAARGQLAADVHAVDGSTAACAPSPPRHRRTPTPARAGR